MTIDAYLRIVGHESTLLKIQQEADIAGAVTRETNAVIEGSDNSKWWNWETPRISVDPDNVDACLKRMLKSYRSSFQVIQTYKGPETEVYLQLVTKYDAKEEPRGLYLSAETIGLLTELGAALDNDTYCAPCG